MSEFAPQARDILHFAKEEAQLLQKNYVGTGHLLLGLLRESTMHPVQLLQRLELDLTRVRNAVEQVDSRDEKFVSFTQGIRQIIHIAGDEAQKRQQQVVAEHLLLALTLLPESQTRLILQHLDINSAELRLQLLQALPPANDAASLLETQTEAKVRDNPGRFTQRARLALYRANEEAWLFEQDLDIEHLFLGLLHAGGGIARQVMKALEVDLNAIDHAFAQLLSQRDHAHLALAPRSKKAIELAVKEAIGFGHRYLGTEHLLLGMIHFSEQRAHDRNMFTNFGRNPNRDNGDRTGVLFANYGLKLKQVRKKTATILLTGTTDNDPA